MLVWSNDTSVELLVTDEAEPMEALPPSLQPLAVMAGTEVVAASSFTPPQISVPHTSSRTILGRTLPFRHALIRHSQFFGVPSTSGTAGTSNEIAKRQSDPERSVSFWTLVLFISKNSHFSHFVCFFLLQHYCFYTIKKCEVFVYEDIV